MRTALVDYAVSSGSSAPARKAAAPLEPGPERTHEAERGDPPESKRNPDPRVRERIARDARAAGALASAADLSGERRHALKQRVIVEYLGLADAIARRFHGSGVEPNELRQVAYLGLTKAIQRFDADSGSGIAAFAVPTVSGEIKRYLRDATWAVRPPRALQELSLELRARVPALTQRLGREPTVDELATEVRRTPARVAEALRCMGGRQALSLDAPVGSGDGDDDLPGVSLGDALPAYPEDMEERVDLSVTLRSALRAIPLNERRAVHLRYFGDMTQVEIAAEIGVSQMQVSRLLRRGLASLRRELSACGVQE